MRRVRTVAGAVAYTQTGTGSPVVLLHANLHDHHDFDPIVPALALEHRVIAVDWPGHGESDRHPAVTAPLLADALADLVAGLGLERAVFIGNSVGGYAAARLAIEEPDRVAGLVLVNSGGFVPRTLATRLYCRTVGTPAIARRFAARSIRDYMKPANAHDEAVITRTQRALGTADGIATYTSLWRSFNDPRANLRAHAARITAPTLIVWGIRDPVIPLRFGRAAHHAIAGSRFETLATGHVVFSSAPTEFLRLVEPFLRFAHTAST